MDDFSKHQRASPEERCNGGSVRGARCRAFPKLLLHALSHNSSLGNVLHLTHQKQQTLILTAWLFSASIMQGASPEERCNVGSVRGVRCRAEVFQNDEVIIAWKMPHGRGKTSFLGVRLFFQWLGELIIAMLQGGKNLCCA